MGDISLTVILFCLFYFFYYFLLIDVSKSDEVSKPRKICYYLRQMFCMRTHSYYFGNAADFILLLFLLSAFKGGETACVPGFYVDYSIRMAILFGWIFCRPFGRSMAMSSVFTRPIFDMQLRKGWSG